MWLKDSGYAFVCILIALTQTQWTRLDRLERPICRLRYEDTNYNAVCASLCCIHF